MLDPTDPAETRAREVDSLLASFERCAGPEDRARVAEALRRTAVEDERIRAAFVRMLEDDPIEGSRCLAAFGDPRSVADLARALDRLLAAPIGDCVLCDGVHLVSIAMAIGALGGTVSPARQTAIEAVLARGDALLVPFEDPLAAPGPPRPPARRGRPGRNDPCHCGSGKKYKRCHLAADERDGWH